MRTLCSKKRFENLKFEATVLDTILYVNSCGWGLEFLGVFQFPSFLSLSSLRLREKTQWVEHWSTASQCLLCMWVERLRHLRKKDWQVEERQRILSNPCIRFFFCIPPLDELTEEEERIQSERDRLRKKLRENRKIAPLGSSSSSSLRYWFLSLLSFLSIPLFVIDKFNLIIYIFNELTNSDIIPTLSMTLSLILFMHVCMCVLERKMNSTKDTHQHHLQQ
jgi:hypothetical protein